MQSPHKIALIVMFFCPLFFSTNIVFGRMGLESGIQPFTLAMLRWAITSFVLFILFYKSFQNIMMVLKQHKQSLFIAAFLGMWICGGIVYWGLLHTSATNGLLIYTTAPVMVILLEAIFKGRKCHLREILGILSAIFGIFFVIFKGKLAHLLAIAFNQGDILFLISTLSWALYTLSLKHTGLKTLPPQTQLGIIAGIGALLLLPVSLYEIAYIGDFPTTWLQWKVIGGLVLSSSLIAFLSYQYGIRHLGASMASIFMYLMPIYGSFLSVILLGEDILSYQIIGAFFVIMGVVIATFPLAIFYQWLQTPKIK